VQPPEVVVALLLRACGVACAAARSQSWPLKGKWRKTSRVVLASAGKTSRHSI
jgi:hypothetical protein